MDLIPQKSSTQKIYVNHYSRKLKSNMLTSRRIHRNNAVTDISKEAIVKAMEVATGHMEERSLQSPLRPLRRLVHQEPAARQITLLITPNITAAKILMPRMVRILQPTIPLFKPAESPAILSRDCRAPPKSMVLTWRNTTGGYQNYVAYYQVRTIGVNLSSLVTNLGHSKPLYAHFGVLPLSMCQTLGGKIDYSNKPSLLFPNLFH